ncbi:hypothetical protein [Vibrio owensii]|uniref:hypothetical protein n=1 Tax=Vibrio owensii TaxID=696485 RepID=UPI003CC684DA
MNNNSIVQSANYQFSQKEEVQYKTQEDLRKDMFFQSHNFMQPDGKINGGLDANGVYKAHSISPEYEFFESQVEKGIWPCVKALTDKGYHTISSCEGHPAGCRIKLGFGTEKCREQFMEKVEALKLPTFKLVPHDFTINLTQTNNVNEKDSLVTCRDYDKLTEDDMQTMQTKSFNMQFNKVYRQWYLLDVLFLEDTLNPFKFLYVRYHMRNKSRIFQALENLFLSDDLPKYSEIYRKNFRDKYFNHRCK